MSAPLCGARVNVCPSGTLGRPVNVGPWLPGMCGSTTVFSSGLP